MWPAWNSRVYMRFGLYFNWVWHPATEDYTKPSFSRDLVFNGTLNQCSRVHFLFGVPLARNRNKDTSSLLVSLVLKNGEKVSDNPSDRRKSALCVSKYSRDFFSRLFSSTQPRRTLLRVQRAGPWIDSDREI
jgi:hypothetical protein